MSIFHVPDIHCEACINALTRAVHTVDAAASLNANLQNKQVAVNTIASDASIAAALQDAGFTVERT